ncbi:hypothetical protein CRUP_012728 [Coryphaenoides rupestris]|nr:hypothetical protein CRUP_012728 [Coryphaenoides rupestris]
MMIPLLEYLGNISKRRSGNTRVHLLVEENHYTVFSSQLRVKDELVGDYASSGDEELVEVAAPQVVQRVHAHKLNTAPPLQRNQPWDLTQNCREFLFTSLIISTRLLNTSGCSWLIRVLRAAGGGTGPSSASRSRPGYGSGRLLSLPASAGLLRLWRGVSSRSGRGLLLKWPGLHILAATSSRRTNSTTKVPDWVLQRLADGSTGSSRLLFLRCSASSSSSSSCCCCSSFSSSFSSFSSSSFRPPAVLGDQLRPRLRQWLRPLRLVLIGGWVELQQVVESHLPLHTSRQLRGGVGSGLDQSLVECRGEPSQHRIPGGPRTPRTLPRGLMGGQTALQSISSLSGLAGTEEKGGK